MISQMLGSFLLAALDCTKPLKQLNKLSSTTWKSPSKTSLANSETLKGPIFLNSGIEQMA